MYESRPRAASSTSAPYAMVSSEAALPFSGGMLPPSSREAVWLADALYFSTGESEGKAKNLEQNAHCILRPCLPPRAL